MLAVSLYILTRDQNRNMAITALLCPTAEGITNAFSALGTLGLLSVATASTLATATDSAATHALGVLLLQQDSYSVFICTMCFAVGSTFYSFLFLRARSIPVLLAWLGIFASVLLVVALPLRLFGLLSGAVNMLIWLPMFVFEVTLALWLLIKGVNIPGTA